VLSIRKEEKLSTLPWLDSWLRNLDLAGKLRLFLYQGDVNWTVGRLLLTSAMVGGAFGSLIFLRSGALLLASMVTLGGATLPFLYVYRKREKRLEQVRQLLPEALELMVSAIRAGHSFSSAMGMAAKESMEPIRREFRQCFEEQNYGMDTRGALFNLQYRLHIG